MILHVLLDLNLRAWPPTNPLNNLQVLINAFLLSGISKKVKIISSKQIIYDSEQSISFESFFEAIQKLIGNLTSDNFKETTLTPNDLAYSLMEKPDQILIFNFSEENPSEYLKYLKCMFTGQNNKIKIHSFSFRDSSFLKMCAEGTNGSYLTSFELDLLFNIFGIDQKSFSSPHQKCLCCNKNVLIGNVCPICLAVYCKFIPVCRNCKSKFSFPKK